MLKAVLIVGTGSFAGGALRYLVSYLMKGAGSGFPWGTLTVNLAGCLLIGLLYGLFSRFSTTESPWCLLLTTGFCGGFTTFSAFSRETFLLFESGNLSGAVIYASVSVIAGTALAGLGWALVKAV